MQQGKHLSGLLQGASGPAASPLSLIILCQLAVDGAEFPGRDAIELSCGLHEFVIIEKT